MILLVCGSRDTPMYVGPYIEEFIKTLGPSLVIHGDANGADRLGGVRAQKLGIPVKDFPADWKKHGRAAGLIRNQQMLDFGPDIVLAVYPHSGITKGTRDMVNRAKAKGVAVFPLLW